MYNTQQLQQQQQQRNQNNNNSASCNSDNTTPPLQAVPSKNSFGSAPVGMPPLDDSNSKLMGLREASHVSLPDTPHAHEYQPLCQCADCQLLLRDHTNYSMLDSFLTKHLPWERQRSAEELGQLASEAASMRVAQFGRALFEYQQAFMAGNSMNASLRQGDNTLDRRILAYANESVRRFAALNGVFPPFFFLHLHTMKHMTPKTRNFSLNVYLRDTDSATISARESVRAGWPFMEVDVNDIVSTRQVSRRGHADKPYRQLQRLQQERSARHRNSSGTNSGVNSNTASHATTPFTTPHLGASQPPQTASSASGSSMPSLPALPMAHGASWYSEEQQQSNNNNSNNNNSLDTSKDLRDDDTTSAPPQTASSGQVQQQQQQQQPLHRSPVTRSGDGAGLFPTANPFPASSSGWRYSNSNSGSQPRSSTNQQLPLPPQYPLPRSARQHQAVIVEPQHMQQQQQQMPPPPFAYAVNQAGFVDANTAAAYLMMQQANTYTTTVSNNSLQYMSHGGYSSAPQAGYYQQQQ